MSTSGSGSRAPANAQETDPWVLVYQGFEPKRERLREALCALGNGHFVTRGAAEEARAGDVRYPGTYFAGGYNRLESEVSGRTVVNEDLVNFPNWLPLTFRPEEGEWLDLARVEVLDYRQELRLHEGLLVRLLGFRDKEGRETRLESRRVVSMAYPHLGAIDYRITPLNWGGVLRIRSGIDGSVRNTGVARYRQLANQHLEVVSKGRVSPEGVYLVARASESRFEVAEAVRTRVYRGAQQVEVESTILDQQASRIGEEIVLEAEQGATVRVEKTAALFASNDRGHGEPGLEARHAVRTALDFEGILGPHRRAWQALWRRYDVQIGDESSGDDLLREQLTLRLYIFQLLQSVSHHTVGLDVGAPARGLHGEAYRGHIFWDELFVLPFYNMRQPAITRSLLLYRYYRLDSALQLASEAGYAGAMYPWQSSHDGREATQQLHLNPLSGEWGPDWSYLQRHVNAAVVYNIFRYWEATGDLEFVRDYAAPMMLQIARFWASLAVWSEERARWEIHGVVGPDEYHEKYPDAEVGGLRNNAYTNVMAAWCLHRTLEVLDEVGESYRAELLAQHDVSREEIDNWGAVADGMFVPFMDGDVIEQFEGYGRLQPFDWARYRQKYGDIERLDRILKAEGDTPDGYRVSKQADATMLFYLFSPGTLGEILGRMGYAFDQNVMERTIDFYRSHTSHGSTLSKLVFASVMHHVDCEQGCQLFLEALRADIDDVQGGTTAEGIHLGAMAGTVAIVLHRYAGVELSPRGLHFTPEIPSLLRRIRCRVHWRGRWVGVDLTPERLRLTADGDQPEPVPVCIGETWRTIRPGDAVEVPL